MTFFFFFHCPLNALALKISIYCKHAKRHFIISNYISVFAKMQFFKISVILYFSVGLLFFFFFSRQILSAAARPISTKFGTHMSPCSGQKKTRAIFEKLKNQVTTAKTSKNRSIFRPRRHVFAHCDETIKVF